METTFYVHLTKEQAEQLLQKARCCCAACREVNMPTEEELEQRITDMIDQESFENAIREAIEKGEYKISRKGGVNE